MENLRPNIMLELSIVGTHFSIDCFTNLVGITPTKSYYKGDPFPVNYGKSKLEAYDSILPLRTRIETCWSYSTGYRICDDLDEISKDLIKKFSHCIDAIHKFIETNDLQISLCITGSFAISDVPNISISYDLSQFAASLRTGIEIDLYYNCMKCIERGDIYLN